MLETEDPHPEEREKSPEEIFREIEQSGGMEDVPSVFAPTPSLPSPTILESLALLLAVVVFDLTLYPVAGYTSFALFLTSMAILLWVGVPRREMNWTSGLLTAAIVILSGRLVWEGDALGTVLGFFLVGGLSLSLSGLTPYVFEGAAAIMVNVLCGIQILFLSYRSRRLKIGNSSLRVNAILIPLLILMIFSGLFILANPVLRDKVREGFNYLVEILLASPITFGRVVIWFLVLWAVAGLCRGERFKGSMKRFTQETEELMENVNPTKSSPTHAFTLARNTLCSVTVLFAAYLIFEISYLWMREIPEGFYYSGYAHEGAMWLTLALAFSTFTLGFIFHGALLTHPRVAFLKTWTWIWTMQNILLAVCVYYRVHIYIEYNGMTRMRMVALYGIFAVLLGFSLVVWKVLKGRDLLWLIRRDLWALFAVFYLFFLTPVDRWVHQYNVSQILSGNPSPAVQISVHPIRPSGLPALLPLLKSEDPIIRAGIQGLLSQNREELRVKQSQAPDPPWRFYQSSKNSTLSLLDNHASQLEEMNNPQIRGSAIEEFHRYVGQWFD